MRKSVGWNWPRTDTDVITSRQGKWTVITVFCTFRKLEERPNMLSRNMKERLGWPSAFGF